MPIKFMKRAKTWRAQMSFQGQKFQVDDLNSKLEAEFVEYMFAKSFGRKNLREPKLERAKQFSLVMRMFFECGYDDPDWLVYRRFIVCYICESGIEEYVFRDEEEQVKYSEEHDRYIREDSKLYYAKADNDYVFVGKFYDPYVADYAGKYLLTYYDNQRFLKYRKKFIERHQSVPREMLQVAEQIVEKFL